MVSRVAARLSACVQAALVEYCDARDVHAPEVDYLREHARQVLAKGRRTTWRNGLSALDEKSDVPAFRRLIELLGMREEDTFILGLAAEADNSHEVVLVLDALAGEARVLRPPVHLVLDIVEVLFGTVWLPDDFLDRPPVTAGVLELEGQGPLPLRQVCTQPDFWRLVTQVDAVWPGCEKLGKGVDSLVNRAFRERIPQLAAMLGADEIGGLVLRGNPNAGRRNVASLVAEALDLQAVLVDAASWERSSVMRGAFDVAGWLPVLVPDLGPGERWRVAARGRNPLVILLGQDGALHGNDVLEFTVPLPNRSERRTLWRRYLGSREYLGALSGALLSGRMIYRIAQTARLMAQEAEVELDLDVLREARSSIGGDRLRTLAQPVAPIASDALVLPPRLENTFDLMQARAERRDGLFHGMGVTLADERNLGLRVLFVGESGTGKTLAAAHLAARLAAPLFRVDVASVLNKYVGESEKNLSALLADAAAMDAVLLFDEADSLFGRRSEGGEKDAGQKFSSMLTNFLLTRIENHPGIVILTTNQRERIDAAFTRRLDYVVAFSRPSASERVRLWKSHLGDASPGEEFVTRLAAYCDLPGGNIRNIVISAASERSARARRIGESELARAVEREYRKLGRVTPAQIKRMV